MNPPHARNSETSRLAAESIAPDTARLRRKVLMFISHLSQDGVTCDQVEYFSGLSHQTTSARIKELKDRGMIQPLIIDGAPVRRPTRSGRTATVYVTTKP